MKNTLSVKSINNAFEEPIMPKKHVTYSVVFDGRLVLVTDDPDIQTVVDFARQNTEEQSTFTRT